jgi:2-C-methyl-D-erythritol 2,4-cyclodiphosphate synthase
MPAAKKTVRVGLGYDIHRLRRGRRLVLGGVEIRHPLGLDGHSDADVICHAVADSLLGAAGLGDIGGHFPNTDPRYRGISSLRLLAAVASMLKRRRMAIINIDAVLLAERPKISPHAQAMRSNISGALGIPVSRVSVKATTHEGLGEVGRGRGMAAMAVSLVEAGR